MTWLRGNDGPRNAAYQSGSVIVLVGLSVVRASVQAASLFRYRKPWIAFIPESYVTSNVGKNTSMIDLYFNGNGDFNNPL